MLSTLRVSTLLLLICAWCAVCNAKDRTFVLSGVVSEVPASLSDEFAVGEPIYGHYTFDTDARDRFPHRSNDGTYTLAVSSFDMTIGDYGLTTNSEGDITVKNGWRGEDNYTVVSFASGEPIGRIEPLLMALQLSDSSETVFQNDLLPQIPPAIDRFDSPEITIDFSGGGAFTRLIGNLKTLELASPLAEGTSELLQVPEPSTAWAFGVAAAAFLMRCRQRPSRVCVS